MPAPSPRRSRPARQVGRALLAGALLVAAGGLAGCSKGDDATPPSTTSATTGMQDAYVRAVRAGVGQYLAKGASDDEVACIAEVWVDVIGLDAFTSRQITPAQVAAPSFPYASLDITDATADQMLDAFDTCGVDLVGFALDALGPLADEERAACIADAVTSEQARDIGRSLLVGGEAAAAGSEAIAEIAGRCGFDLSQTAPS